MVTAGVLVGPVGRVAASDSGVYGVWVDREASGNGSWWGAYEVRRHRRTGSASRVSATVGVVRPSGAIVPRRHRTGTREAFTGRRGRGWVGAGDRTRHPRREPVDRP